MTFTQWWEAEGQHFLTASGAAEAAWDYQVARIAALEGALGSLLDEMWYEPGEEEYGENYCVRAHEVAKARAVAGWYFRESV